MKKICKCEKINEKLQFCLLRLSSTTNGMDKPFVDWYKTTQEELS